MKSQLLARFFGSGALLMTCAVAAQAQKAGHAATPAPHPVTHPTPTPQRAEPATPATRATPATKTPGQRAEPAVPATRAIPATPSPKAGDKAEDRAEKEALRRANDQDKALTHGIHLTKSEGKSIRAIEKKYDARFRDLRKSGGTVAQINALRDQERAEIRAALTSSQQTIFDRNVTKYDARKK